MANKHKNKINPNTGERQDRFKKADYKSIIHGDIVAGKDRLSTTKPVLMSAIDKNRFETQSAIGKALCYILGNYCYIEFSIDGKIKRLCIAILNYDKTANFTTSYLPTDIASKAVLKPKDFLRRLARYLSKYGYRLDIEIF
jgi:hypothetical protein